MLKRTLAVAVASAFGSAAMGQTLLSTQRVHVVPITFPPAPGQNLYHNWEVSLAVNPQGTDVVVAWMHAYGSGLHTFDSEVQFNVSTDGIIFDPAAAAALPGAPRSGDPTAVFADAGGTFWIGALSLNFSGVDVYRKLLGQPMTNTFVSLSPADKPWLIYGPDFGTGSPALFMTLAHGGMWEISSTTDLGVNWNLPGASAAPPGPTIGGGGPSSSIIKNGINSGRRLIVSQDSSRPAVVQYLNSAGQWVYANPLPAFAVVPTNPSQTEEISVAPPLSSLGSPGAKLGLVAMAVDPTPIPGNNQNRVYAAFSGTAPSTGGSTNIDLFVAQSTDGGQTFPASQVLHLPDSLIAPPGGGAHQITPAITVDHDGGVNLVLWEVTNPTDVYPPVWSYR
jgi:hypothetical protein